MNKEELLYNEIYERTKDFGRTQFVRELMRLQRENKELQQKVNQLESTLNEIIDWKDKNGNRYIYQDSLGEDWCFYDLDVFDELGEILNKVGG